MFVVLHNSKTRSDFWTHLEGVTPTHTEPHYGVTALALYQNRLYQNFLCYDILQIVTSGLLISGFFMLQYIKNCCIRIAYIRNNHITLALLLFSGV